MFEIVELGMERKKGEKSKQNQVSSGFIAYTLKQFKIH
jgi:hypothetical protein